MGGLRGVKTSGQSGGDLVDAQTETLDQSLVWTEHHLCVFRLETSAF